MSFEIESDDGTGISAHTTDDVRTNTTSTQKRYKSVSSGQARRVTLFKGCVLKSGKNTIHEASGESSPCAGSAEN
jgi:hypothetical protein